MRILFLGSLKNGQTSLERLKALQSLGHQTVGINVERPLNIVGRALIKLLQMFGIYPDFMGLNREIRTTVRSRSFDLIWVEKGIAIKPSTLNLIKKIHPLSRLTHLNPDDPFGSYRNGWGLFLRGLALYDVHFVARVPNVDEYIQHGGKNIHVYDRSFSLPLHRPMILSDDDRKRFAAPVGFIGSHALHRAHAIAHLIRNGIPVAVYGNGWIGSEAWETIRPNFRSKGLLADEYVKAINGMDIALHFLRRENRDEQDSRTFEIPACGVCMIAERSFKHEAFFRENEEAIFFDTQEELLEKVRYYLAHPSESRRIATAGRQRSLASGYDHHSRMKALLEIAFHEH